MANRGPQIDDDSAGELFARLIEDSGEVVRAELNLYRATAIRRLFRSRTGIALAIVGVLLAQASVTTLLVGIAMGLARWLGPFGAGLAVGLAGIATTFLLFRTAARHFRKAAARGAQESRDAAGKRIS